MSAPAAAAEATARQIADAVLYEGYVLFPYRASAAKNRYRWQWGVVVPTQQGAVAPGEPVAMACQIPLQVDDLAGASVGVAARFLHLRRRQVEDADGQPLDQVEVDGHLHVSWDEGVEHSVGPEPWPVLALLEGAHRHAFHLAGETTTEPVGTGRMRRTLQPIDGQVEVSLDVLPDGAMRLTATVTNLTDWSRPHADRDEVLRHALVGTHLILTVTDGRFGSLVDPPGWARTAAEACRSRTLYPVLVGAPGDDQVVLAAPIILDDHPRIAPESPGPSFDGLEIDELLALCVRGLTDAEKREARATDPRAAELIARSETLPPAALARLHGRLQGPPLSDDGLDPALDGEVADLLGAAGETLEVVDVDGVKVRLGDRVTLRPQRRADVHDLFVAGRVAIVERIVATVDGPTMLAVTIEDDPAADLHRWYGRFQYFHLDEVEPRPDPEDDR